MCGIVGYVGSERAAPVLLRGLKRLEYRGYDSAGIAVLEKRLAVAKRKGSVDALAYAATYGGNLGIGHTRWATHGAPSEENAHPHVFGRFAIVHNGIIENYLALKEECLERGERFSSETDSETIVHLLAYYDRGDFAEAFRKTVARLRGSFAIAALCEGCDYILAAREKSPLIVGTGKSGVYLASDIPAVAEECDSVYSLSDGEIALLKKGEAVFFDQTGEIAKKPLAIDLKGEHADRNGYAHYMRKEMAEIPAAIADSLIDFESKSRFSALCEVLCHTEYIHIVACGTAFHSGIAAKYAIEKLARVPTEAIVASEYRYRDPILNRGALVVAVSQSGETADTLAAAELARERGAPVVAVTNTPYSSLMRAADFVLETRAGREVAVAATKSFNAQLATLYSLCAALTRAKGGRADLAALRLLPALSEQAVSASERMQNFASEFAAAKSVYFIGRGVDYCSALEGSLKLKEISYLPSEGYPAGELKHGTLALIGEGTPVVAVLTQRSLAEKTMNAVAEVRARGGQVLLVTSLADYAARSDAERTVLLPACEEIYSPILSVIPLQALAYYTALARGNDPDKPRNLAKSVTVE